MEKLQIILETETVSTNLRLVVVPSFGLVSPRGVGSVAAVPTQRLLILRTKDDEKLLKL